jgi:hypothetical protein
MDILTPLQTAQGKLQPKGKQELCPIHHIKGRITNWQPPSGIDPLLREFQCPIRKHAFYEIIKNHKKAEVVSGKFSE